MDKRKVFNIIIMLLLGIYTVTWFITGKEILFKATVILFLWLIYMKLGDQNG